MFRAESKGEAGLYRRAFVGHDHNCKGLVVPSRRIQGSGNPVKPEANPLPCAIFCIVQPVCWVGRIVNDDLEARLFNL